MKKIYSDEMIKTVMEERQAGRIPREIIGQTGRETEKIIRLPHPLKKKAMGRQEKRRKQ